MRSLIIRGGTLALPDGDPQEPGTRIRRVLGDLAIEDGVITAVGRVPPASAEDEVVDATGLLVMPGVIDPQVHFREPGFPQKEDIGSGSRACAAGGVTSFLEMPNTQPPTTSRAAFDDKLERAARTSLVNYGFFIGATPTNLDELLATEADDDICGIKIFMGSSTGTLLVNDAADLARIFGNGRRLIAVHAEDEARLVERKKTFGATTDVAMHSRIRDAEAARLASALALELSERFDRRLHILHLSTADEVALIAERGQGVRKVDGRTYSRVTAEVTPQHLTLIAPEVYARLGTRAQMNPPLREQEHAEALWRGLHAGLLDCIATDHAPHTLEEKAKGYGAAPSGMPGVETALAVMLDAAHKGRCAVEDVVRWMTLGPARCYRIANKGALIAGFDGDVALVDLGSTRTVESRTIRARVGWSPYEGLPITGWPVATFVGGRAVYRDGELVESGVGAKLRFTAR